MSDCSNPKFAPYEGAVTAKICLSDGRTFEKGLPVGAGCHVALVEVAGVMYLPVNNPLHCLNCPNAADLGNTIGIAAKEEM